MTNPIRRQDETALLEAMTKEGRLTVDTHRHRTIPKPRDEIEADIRAVLEHGRMTAPAVSESLGKSPGFAHVHLVRMAIDGKLTRSAISTGKSRIYLYRLKETDQ